jgi:hypothetical protein
MTARDTALAHYSAENAKLDPEANARDVLGAGWIDTAPTRRATTAEMIAMGYRPVRVDVMTQYRRWLLWSLKSGSLVAVFMGGMLCGLYVAAWGMM